MPTGKKQMTEHTITSIADDNHKHHYMFDEEAPLEGITIDEASGTVTCHGRSDVEGALKNLFAIERDRLLGYHHDLHMPVQEAVIDAWDTLAEHGYHRDELILPEDQEALNLVD